MSLTLCYKPGWNLHDCLAHSNQNCSIACVSFMADATNQLSLVILGMGVRFFSLKSLRQQIQSS